MCMSIAVKWSEAPPSPPQFSSWTRYFPQCCYLSEINPHKGKNASETRWKDKLVNKTPPGCWLEAAQWHWCFLTQHLMWHLHTGNALGTPTHTHTHVTARTNMGHITLPTNRPRLLSRLPLVQMDRKTRSSSLWWWWRRLQVVPHWDTNTEASWESCTVDRRKLKSHWMNI